MRLSHIGLAVLITCCWGLNFVVIRLGLGTMPPFFLAGVRFGLVALLVLFVPRPKIALSRLVLLGLIQFAGQFGFLFEGMAVGMPAGLASLIMQSQVFFTVLFAFLLLGERPKLRSLIGFGVAAIGLGVIGVSIHGSVATDLTFAGFALCLVAAFCWGFGNILMREVAGVNVLSLVSWMSLVATPPLFAASFVLEDTARITQAVTTITWGQGFVALYLAVFATIFAFSGWSYLLRYYQATKVVPFALLVPLFGAGSAWLVLGERFTTLRLVGMGLVVLSLAIIMLPSSIIPAKAKE